MAILADGQFALHDVWIFVSCAIGAFLMRGAGCTWNDITDRKIDGAVERTFPSNSIWSGDCDTGDHMDDIAGGYRGADPIFVQCAGHHPGVCIACFGGDLSVCQTLYLVAAGVLGLAFNWGALMIYVAHSGVLRLEAVLLYAAGIIWTLFYDTIYAHQDREDDALIGKIHCAFVCRSNTNMVVWVFDHIGNITGHRDVFGVRRTWGPFNPCRDVSGACILDASALADGRFDANDPNRLMMLFRSNRDAGLIVVLFFAIAAML